MLSRNPFEEKEPPPHDPNELRPDQKRCRRCRNVVLHEQTRCPFCGNAPWLWSPNARFLLVAFIVGLLLLFLLPMMTKRDPSESAPVSASP